MTRGSNTFMSSRSWLHVALGIAACAGILLLGSVLVRSATLGMMFVRTQIEAAGYDDVVIVSRSSAAEVHGCQRGDSVAVQARAKGVYGRVSLLVCCRSEGQACTIKLLNYLE